LYSRPDASFKRRANGAAGPEHLKTALPEISVIRGRTIRVKELRERGIYTTPGGKQFVASRTRRSVFQTGKAAIETGLGNIFFLFSRYAWAFHERPDFMVDEKGRIVLDESDSRWRIEDLTDTGHTAGAH